ncbi:MAG: nucleoside deaminase [Phycisphaeraceae bacterium]
MQTHCDEHYMRLALGACRAGLDAGQTPFGACIVKDGAVLAVSHNQVWAGTDPSAHAEVVAVREACARTGDVHLEGATIYATTEPCPMCFACIHWARIGRIVFAARVSDAADFGFNELPITNSQMKKLGRARVELTPDLLRENALELYRDWQTRGGRTY